MERGKDERWSYSYSTLLTPAIVDVDPMLIQQADADGMLSLREVRVCVGADQGKT